MFSFLVQKQSALITNYPSNCDLAVGIARTWPVGITRETTSQQTMWVVQTSMEQIQPM